MSYVQPPGSSSPILLSSLVLLRHRDYVPADSRGLYQFVLRFPSDHELGLTDTTRSACAIYDPLNSLLGVLGRLRYEQTVKGYAEDDRASKALRQRYSISLEHELLEEPIKTFFSSLEVNMPASTMRELIGVVRSVWNMHAPLIYMGITTEQSFKTRLDQHLSSSSPLSQRLSRLGIPWHYVRMDCYSITGNSITHAERLERLLHFVTKPELSRG